jgi:hypothetical protein
MANTSGAIRAGRAFVELFADDSKMQQVLTRARNKMKAFGEEMKNIGGGMFDAGAKLFAGGGAIVGAAAAAGKIFSNVGDDLAKMAARTGMSVEALSELRYAADLSATSLESIEGAMRKLQVNLTKADEDGQQAADAIGALGLSVEGLKAMSPDDQLMAIADAIAGIQDPAQRTAFAMRVMGKSATELLPLFSGGAKGIAEMRARARELGLTMSTQTAKQAEALNDALGEMWMVLKNVAVVVGGELAPVLKDAANWITNAAVTTTEWVRENGDMVRMALAGAAAVAGLGVAAMAAGKLIVVAGAAVTVLSGAIGAAQAVMAGAAVVMGAVFSPIGLAIAGITAAVVGLGVVAVKVFPEIGAAIMSGLGSALTWLSGAFAQTKADAIDAWDGIAAAMRSGDLMQAAKIGIGFISLQWLEMKAVALGVWQSVRGYVVNVIEDLKAAWAKMVTFFAGSASAMLSDDFKAAMAEVEKNLDMIDQGRRDAAKGMAQRDAAEMQRLRDEIDAARKAFQDDVARAKTGERKIGEGPKSKSGKGVGDEDDRRIPDPREIFKRNSVRGIFGGTAAVVVQFGDAAERYKEKETKAIAKNTAETAEGISQLNDWIKQNGPVSFGP